MPHLCGGRGGLGGVRRAAGGGGWAVMRPDRGGKEWSLCPLMAPGLKRRGRKGCGASCSRHPEGSPPYSTTPHPRPTGKGGGDPFEPPEGVLPVSNRPEFVGRQWLLAGQGLAYQGESPADLARRIDDPGEWNRLLAIFERMKRGELQLDNVLLQLTAKSEDPEIRFLGLTLLRHTASRECRLCIAGFFLNEDIDTRTAAYDAALYSADLRLVEPLLSAYRSARGDERSVIMHAITHLLEPEPDQLYDDTGELSVDEYDRATRAILQGVEARHVGGAAVFEGRLLSLPRVLERIELLCGDPEAIEHSGTIGTYFDLFEAMTGQSCVGVFDETVSVDPYSAMRLIDEFRETDRPARFTPGQRYFFGHELPS